MNEKKVMGQTLVWLILLLLPAAAISDEGLNSGDTAWMLTTTVLYDQ